MGSPERKGNLSLPLRILAVLLTASSIPAASVFSATLLYFYLDFPVERLSFMPRLSENPHFDLCLWVDCRSNPLRVFYKTLWNYVFMAVFFVQHYFMSQKGFKERMFLRMREYERLERSIYNLLASLFSLLMFFLWQPLTDFNFEVPQSWLAANLLFKLACFLFMSVAFFQIDIFHLKQIYHSCVKGNADYKDTFSLKTDLAYSLTRNPIFVGLNLFMLTPMNYNLGFLTNYVGMLLVQIPAQIQENDYLLESAGYKEYAEKVPRFIRLPFFKPSISKAKKL